MVYWQINLCYQLAEIESLVPRHLAVTLHIELLSSCTLVFLCIDLCSPYLNSINTNTLEEKIKSEIVLKGYLTNNYYFMIQCTLHNHS